MTARARTTMTAMTTAARTTRTTPTTRTPAAARATTRRMAWTAAWLLCAVAGQAPAAANPVDAFGFGARGAAMGGAQTAATDDGAANYYNPAALALFDDIRIELGYQLASPTLVVNGLDLGVDASRGLVAGLTAPGQIAGRRVAIGVGMFLPDQHITRTRALAATKPRFVLYDNRPQRLFLAANAAVAITDTLTIGGGVSYMSRTRGVVLLDGRIGFPNADDSDLALGIDVDLQTIRYGQVGALWQALPWLAVGATYRGGFALVLDQVFEVRGDVGNGDDPPIVDDGFLLLHTVSQDLFQPAQVTAGLDAQISGDVAVAIDVQWQRWSAYENPAARIEVDLDVGQFNDMINIRDQPPLPDPRFHDIVVPRVGVEWMASRSARRDVAVRGGYALETSPVPQQFGESNFIDATKHTLSVGAGLTLRDVTEIIPLPIGIDAHAAVTVLDERSQRKISPADPIGDWRAGGRVVQVGITSRWRF